MDELQQLIALAGGTTFAEACANMTAVNTALSGARTALGTKDAAATFAALDTCRTQLAAIEKATGKQGDECVGAVRAALTSHEELPKLQKLYAELEAKGATNELDTAITKAKAANKLTPALEAKVREEYASKDVTLKGAISWLENLPAIPALQNARTEKREPAKTSEQSKAELQKHEGKTFNEMTGLERAALRKSDRSLYESMRSEAMGRNPAA